MVRCVDPKLGKKVYDPCCGSAGFLVASAEHIAPATKTTESAISSTQDDLRSGVRRDRCFVRTMNLMLHGVEDPQIVRRNTLEQDIRNIPPQRPVRHHPDQPAVRRHREPAGAAELPRASPLPPSCSSFSTAWRSFETEGAAIVLPDGILYRTETGFTTVRRRLINEFNVTAIVRLPTGVFPTAADTRTNLIFFSKGGTNRGHSLLPGALATGKALLQQTQIR